MEVEVLTTEDMELFREFVRRAAEIQRVAADRCALSLDSYLTMSYDEWKAAKLLISVVNAAAQEIHEFLPEICTGITARRATEILRSVESLDNRSADCLEILMTNHPKRKHVTDVGGN
jgi:hypothetical protein